MKSAATSPDVKEADPHQIELLEEPLLGQTYHLILWNDDVTPVNLVIHLLMKLLRYTRPNAIAKTRAIETFGKGIIYTGSLELCELRHEQFTESKLTTTIEPA